MKNSNSSEEVTYKSGNIFGWKISFISLGIILVTLVAVIISENQKKKMENKGSQTVVDSLGIQKNDSLKILE